MTEEYSSQKDYIDKVKGIAETRQEEVETALKNAFRKHIEKREVEVIIFSDMTSNDLASAIYSYQLILKPLLACCSIAGRAIERDLGMKNLDTYSPHLDKENANIIAGYIKAFLPPYIELPAIVGIDRIWYIDKEIRKGKGRWEKLIVVALNKFGNNTFFKRKFEADREEFEIDTGAPPKGDIQIGIDIKRKFI